MFNHDLEVLREVLPDLNAAALNALYHSAHIAEYAAGTTLCTDGRVEDTLYILVRGRATVTKCLEGETHTLDILNEGTCVGELGFILDAPRTANVVASEPVRVLEITQDALKQHAHTHPEIMLALARVVLRRMLRQQETLLAQIAVFRRHTLPPPRLFVSYSRHDQAFAHRLFYRLRHHQMDVWLDTFNIKGGGDWPGEIEAGLAGCEVMILILTPRSSASERVEIEWRHFLDAGKPIIPIRLEPCAIPPALNAVQYVDFVDRDFELAFGRLLAELTLFETNAACSDEPSHATP